MDRGEGLVKLFVEFDLFVASKDFHLSSGGVLSKVQAIETG